MKFLLLAVSLMFSFSASADVQTFRMYKEPWAKINRECDVYRELIINASWGAQLPLIELVSPAIKVQLQNRFGGNPNAECKINPHPELKFYNVTFTHLSLNGLKTYSGPGIQIVDYRGHVDGRGEPVIFVKEESPGGRMFSLEEVK